MSNLVLRSAEARDLDAIHALAKDSGFGLTTLPKDKKILKQRLEQSLEQSPTESTYYLFVLEDLKNHQLIGTSAIETAVGAEAPFYSYKLSKRIKSIRPNPKQTAEPNQPKNNPEEEHEDQILSLVNDHQGHTELCTLYLNPAYRHEKQGAFLSRARFLFMAAYPERFAPTVIAEMRGITTPDGNSPFWEALGRHFFNLSFAEADRLTLSTDKQFIADFMPEYPIYVKLLSPEAQAALGKPHASTLPAMQLLINEGFHYNHYVDIFDAGPVLEAPLNQIQTFNACQAFTLKSTNKTIQSSTFMLANTQRPFRATRNQAELNTENNTCILTADTAKVLNLHLGDPVLIAPF